MNQPRTDAPTPIAVQSSEQPPSQQPRLPRWARWLPSAGDVLLLAMFSLLMGLPPYDTDLWWHLRTGDWILEHVQVPRVDMYSFTALGRPWIAHEWLSEIGMALAWRAAGIEGIAVAQALVIVCVLAVLYRHMSTDRVPGVVTVPLLAVVLLLLMPSAHPRPYLFTLLGLSLLQMLVRGAPTRRTFVLVPLLFFVWANLHAGFALGVGWLVLCAIGAWWSARRPPWAHLALLALAVAAAAINPNGVHLLLYPFEYGTGSTLYRFVVEWASPDFHLTFNWIVEAYLLVALLAVVLVRPKGWQRGVVIVLAFGHLALMSVRNIPVFAVVAAPYIGLALAQLLPASLTTTVGEPLLVAVPAKSFVARLGQKFRTVLVFDGRHNSVWWFVVVAMLVGASTLFGQHAPENWVPSESPRTKGQGFPYEVVELLGDTQLDGNLLNDDGWGGYLIWSLYPDQPVFIDGRFDVYGETITTDYVGLVGLSEGWGERLDRYSIEHVLLKPHVPLAQTLRHACGWEVRFEDRSSVLMSRPAEGICP